MAVPFLHSFSINKEYPIGTEHYTLLEEIGKGFSSRVYRGLCLDFNQIVAIKFFDYEHHKYGLHDLYRERDTMKLVDHPNLLKSHCSFLGEFGGKEKTLWIVMPFMSWGSCLHILKAAHLNGFEEVYIAAVLVEVLKALQYLHHQGYVHRDVKAGNILINNDGSVKLGDFGMSACLFDSRDTWTRSRNAFVSTPCWMAPEVIDLEGFSFKSVRADIWSFGITALELAHGHAPFSKFPPSKVLLRTLENNDKFSKSFKQMIACCLVKDPTKRPSAKKLLEHSFFKQASSSDYNTQTLLEGLAALGDFMKTTGEVMLAKFKMPDQQQMESRKNYRKDIECWNSNPEDMTAQTASLINEIEDATSDISHVGRSSSSNLEAQDKQLAGGSPNSSQSADMEESNKLYKAPVPRTYRKALVTVKRVPKGEEDDEGKIYRVQIDTTTIFTLVAKSCACAANWVKCYKKDNEDRTVIGVEFKFVSRKIDGNDIEDLAIIALSDGISCTICQLKNFSEFTSLLHALASDETTFVGYDIKRKAQKAKQALDRQRLLPRRFARTLFPVCYDVRQPAHPAFNSPDMKKGTLKSLAERILRREIPPPPTMVPAKTIYSRKMEFSLMKKGRVFKKKKCHLQIKKKGCSWADAILTPPQVQSLTVSAYSSYKIGASMFLFDSRDG